jgi:hypothetical protein
VTGSSIVCCIDPTPAIEQRRGPPTVIELGALFCSNVDCACVGTPHAYEAWHSLGVLDPGSYTVQIGDLSHTFDAP